MRSHLYFILSVLALAVGSCRPAKSLEFPKAVDLSISELNRVPPADIAPEIMFFAGGAGGGGDCKKEYSSPTIEAAPGYAELLQSFTIVTCGWMPDESVTIMVTHPDGTVERKEDTAYPAGLETHGLLSFTYFASRNDQLGDYLIKFTGQDSVLTQRVRIIAPATPRLYYTEGDDLLIFYGFRPNEKVRLFIYENRYAYSNFLGWINVQVSINGALTINRLTLGNELKSQGGKYMYAAVGESSGQILERPEGWSIDEGDEGDEWDGVDVYCEDAPPHLSGIGPNASAKIVANQLIIYEDIDHMTGSQVVPKGDIVFIMGDGSPRCNNSIYWWWGLVTVDDTTSAYWIPEGKGNEYYLEVVK